MAIIPFTVDKTEDQRVKQVFQGASNQKTMEL